MQKLLQNSLQTSLFIIISFLAFANLAMSNDKPVVTSTMQSQTVAIEGYDSVAYFTQDKAIKGSSEYVATYLNVNWWFSSKQNLELFQENPEKYAPQFNGHCANGLSDGHQVPGNPKYYRIIDEKLYFFYSKWGRLQWKFDQADQIILANDFWEANN